MVKNMTVMWETGIQSLGCEDLLEKEMATHSSILAWGIPWTEEPIRLQIPWREEPGGLLHGVAKTCGKVTRLSD